MLLDSMKYKNSYGDEVDFMTATVRSNPREAKLWSYTVTDSGYVQSPKPFSLTVICSSDSSHTGEYYANEVIAKLSKDAPYQESGYLQINGWRLDCSFIGVANIETDIYGVVKFTANFYAPNGFLWYKINANRYTLPSSADWGLSPLIASITSDNVVATKTIFKFYENTTNAKAIIKINQPKNTLNISSSNLNNKYRPTSSSDFNKYYMIDALHKKITIASSTSTNVNLSDSDYKIASEKNAIDYITAPSADDVYLFPWGRNPKIYLTTKNFAYESYAYITFYELRGMPEWKTS